MYMLFARTLAQGLKIFQNRKRTAGSKIKRTIQRQ